MLTLCTLPEDDRSRRECSLRKPVEVGRFSLDDQRQFHHDRRKMSCISVKNNGRLRETFDLNDGYTDRFVKRDDDVKERLNNLLRWLLLNKNRFVGFDKTRSQPNVNVIGTMPDFFLWRGHLTKLMCTPFENRDGWMMACQKLNQTIYVSEVETKEAAFQRKNRSAREGLMTYWGVRFEGYMTGPFPNPSDPAACPAVDQRQLVTNTNQAFCSVLRTRLNQHHSLVYGAEVDCCQPVDVLSPPDCYIELKTNRVFSTSRQRDNFYRFKALKWWAQSYLAGVPRITCGFRNDDGVVQSIETFNTADLPERASHQRNTWNPNTCLAFLDSVLSSIKHVFIEKSLSSNDVMLLIWNPGDRNVSYELSKDPKDHFLPDWFLREITLP